MTVQEAIAHLNSVASHMQLLAISTRKQDLAATLAQAVIKINEAVAELQSDKAK